MQRVWRALPKMGLPVALGLGLAYLGTGFVPRPAPNLRPPEELRAIGQAYAEESPARAILERNVLGLELPMFAPLGQLPTPDAPPPAMDPVPAPGVPAAGGGQQAAFAPVDPSLSTPQSAHGAPLVSEPLSGGHTVVGRIAPPAPATPAVPAASDSSAASSTVPSQHPSAVTASVKPRPAKVPASEKAAPAAPVAPPPPSLNGVRLVGVIAGGAKPLAMLNVDGASQSLSVGQTVHGWTLTAVEPGQVLLQYGEHVRRLVLGSAGARARE